MTNITDILRGIRPGEDFACSSDFIEDGLLDSFDLMMLVSELDRTFTISIEGVDILPENFRNIDAIAALVRKYGGRA